MLGPGVCGSARRGTLGVPSRRRVGSQGLAISQVARLPGVPSLSLTASRGSGTPRYSTDHDLGALELRRAARVGRAQRARSRLSCRHREIGPRGRKSRAAQGGVKGTPARARLLLLPRPREERVAVVSRRERAPA